MNRIKTALISVWDKTNIVDFAQFLVKQKIKILSTGGTKRILQQNGIDVISISEYTEQEEVMNGRVKTLHPKVFGGILADRNNDNHLTDLNNMKGYSIDLVVVNLYPFESEAIDKKLNLSDAIEYIDIGGPSMLRAAAKNYRNIIPICDVNDYDNFKNKYNNDDGVFTLEERLDFALKVFELTSKYDSLIYNYFLNNNESLNIDLFKDEDLRYGENPHQKSSFYLPKNEKKQWEQISGKKLSYNNYFDVEAAISIVYEFSHLSCSIIKHSNPCGFALGSNPKEAYLRAVTVDPISYFGGIVGLNREVNSDLANELVKPFLECIIAPSFSKSAIEILSQKKIGPLS